METWVYILIGLAALAGGMVNALAGGGTLITFPVLTFFGIPALNANITNTIALCPGYFGGTWAQRKDLTGQKNRLIILIPAALIGGIGGGLLLLYTGEHLFQNIVPWLILLAAGLLAFQGLIKKWVSKQESVEQAGWKKNLKSVLLVGPATMYGGYFGAGLGVILLAVLGFSFKDNLTRLNALKQFLSLITNLAAAVFFLFSDKVEWYIVAIMAAGALAGGYLGGKLAGRIKPEILRWAVVIIGTTVAIFMFIKKTNIMLNLWIPAKTIVLLIGVLEWQDTKLATYPKEGRQDQKLYEILMERGVPKDNILYLQDKSATLPAIKEGLQQILNKSDENSTFIFYYAGHGVKTKDGKSAYFLNYEAQTEDPENTCFALTYLGQTIQKYFKGKTVMLSADCCYSGNLNNVADKIHETGIECAVLSSAVSSNSSTGAWTFTESLNDIFSGKPIIGDQKGNITITDAGNYISNNMAYAEFQKSNFYLTSGFPSDYVLSEMKLNFSGQRHIGEIKRTWYKDRYFTGTVICEKDNKYLMHYFGWSSEWDEWHSYDELVNIEFKTWPVGSLVKVEWNGQWYPAKVLKVDGVFHYIHYIDDSDEWNEWVASDRIVE